MNPAGEQIINAPALRTIPWARWFGITLAMMLVLAVGIYFWAQAYITIHVAKDTTYLTAPLLADGYPDYLGYWNAQNSAGVTPENNAWVAILRTIGPREIKDELRAEHFRLLGIPPLAEEASYLRLFYDEKRLEQVPDEVLIAASVAAQMPLHVRFARLVALNVDQLATSIEQYGYSPPAPAYFELQEWLGTFTGGIAERIELTIQDPEAARELELAESLPESEYDPNVVTDEEQLQDLRPEALARIKPQFVEGEGAYTEEDWRKALFLETGRKLLEREDLIISERPWTEAECPLAADWIRRSTPLLDELQRELQRRPQFYAPFVEESGKQFLFSVGLESIQSLRLCAISFSYRSRYYMYNDARASSLRDIQAIFEISRCNSQKPMLVQALMACAIQGIGMQALGEWLRQPGITDEELQQFAAYLAQLPAIPKWETTLDAERWSAVASVVSVAAREKRSLDGNKNTVWESSIVCWDDVLREVNRLYDTLELNAKTGSSFNFAAIVSNAFPARADLDALYEQRPWYLLPSQRTEVLKYAYTRMLQPSLQPLLNAMLKAQVRHDLARVYVALERFRRANNAYPAALAELAPAYLPAVPLDPFDNQPLKYLLTPTGGYRAYSVWSNGVDDGGSPNVGADEPDFQGNDLVIGSPDEIDGKYLFGW